MMNNNREVFGLKSIQSLMREVSLYGGRIDALFGPSCVDAMKALVGNANPSYNPIVAVPTYDATDVFKWVQEYLVRAGKTPNDFKVDGFWGTGTEAELMKLCDLYAEQHGLPSYNSAWTAHPRITPEMEAKVKTWMKKWNKPESHTSYLFSCMALETGRSFDASIMNKFTKATGLIQFMPNTAKDLGTTIEALGKMTEFDQLDYVFAYFEKYGYIKKCARLEDYYLTIFYPAHVGKDPNLKVADKGTKLYDQNSGFDREKKGFYTVGDIAYAITDFYWEGMDPKKRTTK